MGVLQVGNIVCNIVTGAYGTVEWSSFGFSIHTWDETYGLCKTLGTSESEILKYWKKIGMPRGYKLHKYGGIVKMQPEDMYVFIKTNRSLSTGGNAIGMSVMDIDEFIELYKDEVFGHDVPDIRPVRLNSSGGYLLKDLEIDEFEQLFSGRIASMGKLLWYYPTATGVKHKYPLFRKAVYVKYGTKAVKTFVEQELKYSATAM